MKNDIKKEIIVCSSLAFIKDTYIIMKVNPLNTNEDVRKEAFFLRLNYLIIVIFHEAFPFFIFYFNKKEWCA